MSMVIGTPHTKGAGYLQSRYSCDSKLVEADIQTCNHCQRALNMQEWRADGALCSGCDRPLCSLCALEKFKTGKCETFEARLEKALNHAYHRAQFRKVAGI